MSKETFDVIVIGGGPGGTAAAVRSSRLGARVLIVEKGLLGGTCLHRGCVPTKTLLQSAEHFKHAHTLNRFGVQTSDIKLDFELVQKRKTQVIKQLHAGVEKLIQSYGIRCVQGQACFEGAQYLHITGSDGSHTEYTAGTIIIAAGSIPKKPAGFKSAFLCKSTDEVLALTKLPSSIVIVGAGYVGLEFASLFNMMGVRVHVVEMLPRCLHTLDAEVSSVLIKEFERRGISIHTGSRITAIENDKVIVVREDKDRFDCAGEIVLWAAGRKANIEHMGLSTGNITYNEKGISVNRHMQTSNKNVYAVGDAAGNCQLAYTASAEGVVAAEHAAGKKSSMNYNGIPYALYTDPQAAWVGSCEGARIGRFPLLANSKAAIMGNRTGMVKIIADKKGRVLGAHMVGAGVTELIPLAARAVRSGLHIHEWKREQFTHPSLNESLFMAGEDCFSNSIDLPPKEIKAGR